MKNIFIYLLFTVILLTNVTAVSPFQQGESTEGLQVVAPNFQAVKYNTSFNLHLHVLNLTSGKQLSNTLVDCYLHLYGMDGGHIYEHNTPLTKDSNGWDHEILLGAGNFTQEGESNVYYIWCNTTAQGGAVRDNYEITNNGKIIDNSKNSLIIFFSTLLLIILGGSLWALVYTFGHLINLDFDLKDWALNWGAYFVLLGAYQLQAVFLGSLIIDNWLLNFIVWYRYPVIMIPPIAFIISLVANNKRKKAEANKW